MFQLDVMSRTPVYEQLINQIERFILTGIFQPGEKIPSVRILSMELSVNPNTIQKAFSELDRKGLLYSVPGIGCFISENAYKELSIHKRGGLMEIKEKLRELVLAGVTKEELIACINEIFEEGANND